MRSARRHRRALLVVTDGADQHSHRFLEELTLVPLVQASQAQVFIIGYFGKEEYDLYRSSRNQKVTLVTSQEIDNPVTVFKRLANESGAESLFPVSRAKLQEAVDTVAHQLRTQYTLAYYPKSHAGDFRHIEVSVAQSGTRVRTRRGFGRVEHAIAEGPPEQSARREHEELRPYPYESKLHPKMVVQSTTKTSRTKPADGPVSCPHDSGGRRPSTRHSEPGGCRPPSPGGPRSCPRSLGPERAP